MVRVARNCLCLILIALFCSCSASRQSSTTGYNDILLERYKSGGPPAAAYTSAKARNRLIEDIIYLSNSAFNDYIHELYGVSAGIDMAADLLIMGLTSSSALASGASAKTILAAVSAGVAGARISVDKAVFNDYSRVAVITKMQEMRVSTLIAIRTSMDLPISGYSLEQAMLDLQTYVNCGSALTALQVMTEDASLGLESANEELFQLRGINVRD